VGIGSPARSDALPQQPLRVIALFGLLSLVSPCPAHAHGLAIPFAFWGDFSASAVHCQRVLSFATTRCAERAWKVHVSCFNALLDGKSCGVNSVPDLVQQAHLEALNLVDLQCTSPEAQALGFLLKYEAQTDMDNFCRAAENALVSVVYGPVRDGDFVRLSDAQTRLCIEGMARAATRLLRVAIRARLQVLDRIAANDVPPSRKEALLERSAALIERFRTHVQHAVETQCGAAAFTATYHHDAAQLLTLVAQRADCLAAAVYVQTGVNCPSAECGNGMQEPPEQCDDGNLVDGDGCSSTCGIESPTPGQ